jgi:hypothetical protein
LFYVNFPRTFSAFSLFACAGPQKFPEEKGYAEIQRNSSCCFAKYLLSFIIYHHIRTIKQFFRINESLIFKYFLRKNYIRDPYTEEYHFIDEKENRSDPMTWGDLLYHKIREEIFPGDDCEHNKLVEKVKKKLYDSYKSGELNTKDVISSIESNEVYIRSLKNVYWGLDSSELLTPEEMIPSLLASITFTESFLSSSNRVSIFISEIEKLVGSQLNLKYKKMIRLDYRYIRALYRMNKSFDYSSFGKEIEKLYLLLTL